MKKIFYCFLIFTFCACSTKHEIKTFYPSGEIESRYFISKQDSTELVGVYTSYYQNGQTKETVNYKNGIIDGTRTLYYEDGKEMIIESYRSGAFNGPYTSFHPSGNKQSSGEYINNVMIGMWDFYYDTIGSPIKESVTFADNVENGPFIEYYKSGKIAATGTYLNELEHGQTIVYAENGDTLKKIEYDNGRPTFFKDYSKE